MKAVALSTKTRWLPAAVRVMALAVLIAVPVLGIAHFAGDFWPTAQAACADESISSSPFTFDSPSATVVKLRAAQTKPAAAQNNGDKVLLLNDWKFTHSQYQ